MMDRQRYEAVVVGSGPNGLAAAITIAERGGSVLVYEAAPICGGGMRTAELTLPGFQHDVCSAVHPLAVSSPFLRKLPLEKHGTQWIASPNELAHPLGDAAAVLYRSVEKTAAGLGEDAESYEKLMRPWVKMGDALFEEVLQPMLHWPQHPFKLAKFGLEAIQSGRGFADRKFRSEKARAFFAGLAGHSMIPLNWCASSAIALILAVAGHIRGWPIPRGGSQSITNAMVSYLRSLGGRGSHRSEDRIARSAATQSVDFFGCNAEAIFKNRWKSSR